MANLKKSRAINIADKLSKALPSSSFSQESGISAPLTEMSMVVTLDQLRPFKLNPRTTKNPLYDEIKASIRAVGLDHSPNITQLPGDDKYTVRDGGNTRLQILNELYEETGDRRFFEITCFYRPYTDDISMIVGHLSENDNRGDLKWIERALSIKIAKDTYLKKSGLTELSTRELVSRLEENGYKISRSHIVKMFQTLEHIYPSLPGLLMAGMGRPQVEKILSLRQAAWSIWKAAQLDEQKFPKSFHDVLSRFDSEEHEAIAFNILQDAILGMLVDSTNAHFNIVELTFQQLLKAKGKPTESLLMPLKEELGITNLNPPDSKVSNNDEEVESASNVVEKSKEVELEFDFSGPKEDVTQSKASSLILSDFDDGPLNAISRLKAKESNDSFKEFSDNAIHSIPIKSSGPIAPVIDIWHIENYKSSPENLRIQIRQFARSLTNWAGFDARPDDSGAIRIIETGIGFSMAPLDPARDPVTLRAQMTWQLLAGLSGTYNPEYPSDMSMIGSLMGTDTSTLDEPFPDEVFIRFVRLVRLIRKLNSVILELDSE